MKLFTVVCLLCSFSALASDRVEVPADSGNAFLRLCSTMDAQTRTEAEDLNLVACASYLQGLGDGMLIEHYRIAIVSVAKVGNPPFCPPDGGVENGQKVRILLKYIHEHPAQAHKKTALLFGWAMQEAFPCEVPKK